MLPIIQAMRLFSLLFFTIVLFELHVRAEVLDPSQSYIGISISHPKGSDIFVVASVVSGGASDHAGIHKGDVLKAIDGVSTLGKSMVEVRALLNGPIGRKVEVTIQSGTSADKQISVIRLSLGDTYMEAALAGDAKAQDRLGYYYEEGPSSVRDLAKAADWFSKSANQGYAPSETSLGFICTKGLGVPKDFAAAAAWFRKAAQQDDPHAETDLGICYLFGHGAPQSDRDAYDWFYRAAQQDDSVAEHYLGGLYQQGRGVVRDDRAAFAWDFRSAKRGNGEGARNLAYLYDRGIGVKSDAAAALYWYEKALAAYPQNQQIKKSVALAALHDYLENPLSSPRDLTLLLEIARPLLAILFNVFALLYLVSGLYLTWSTFVFVPDITLSLLLAIGWIMFYIESQIAATLGLILFIPAFNPGLLLAGAAIFGVTPILIGSLGSMRERLWKASSVPWATLLAFLAGSLFLLALGSLLYARLYVSVAHHPLPRQPTFALIDKARNASTPLAYLTVALLLPAAEEILFRGYLFDALRRYFSPPWIIVITAAVFSLFHLQLLYFIPLFVFGLILGWVRWKTGSLRLPILLHGLNNAIFLAVALK